MANQQYKAPDGTTKERKARGTGTSGDPFVGEMDVNLLAGHGLATAAGQSAGQTLTGPVDEAAPASDTASSGLNGRLQRIAQRLTSLIGLLPVSLGPKTAANSLSVTLATDGIAANALGAPAEAETAGDGSIIAILKRIRTLLSNTLTVSAAALPLPAGASTAANQATSNTSLSSIDGKLRAPRTISRAIVTLSASGDAAATVAAVAGQKVKIVGLLLMGKGDVDVTLKSSGGTAISPAYPLAVAGNGLVLPVAPIGEHWLETASGEGLVVNLSAAVAVRGHVLYVQEA